MRCLIAVAAAAVALCAPAATLAAVDVDVVGSELRIVSTADEVNDVLVDETVESQALGSTYEITDAVAAPTSVSGDCTIDAGQKKATCQGVFASTVVVKLGPGNDEYDVDPDTRPFVGKVYGEAGRDTLDGFAGDDDIGAGGFASGKDFLSGGPGDGDVLVGGTTGDELDGGPGNNDVMMGGRGADLYSDTLSADPFASGAHDPTAGTGDTVSYGEADRTGGVTVTLDGQENDGGAGYDQSFSDVDNVGGGVDRVDGSAHPDTITGDPFPNELRGGEGADTLAGGTGADSLLGEGGGDTLNAQDGVADAVLNCGGGGTANVDANDPDPVTCATVNRASTGSGGGGDNGAGGGNGGGGGGGGGGGTPSTKDTTPPDTTISGSENQLIDVDLPPAIVTYVLGSSEAGSTFECDVNGSGFGACPGTLRVISAIGQHRVAARAKDAAGNVDASPATRGYGVRQRPVLAPVSRAASTLAAGTMPLVIGQKMDRARDRVLSKIPIAELRFAFRRGCASANDLEVVGQQPPANRRITGSASDDANVTLTVCLAESDWLRDCELDELEGDLAKFRGREDFELAYDTALKVTKCKVDYDIRLVRGPDEAFLRLRAQRDAARTRRDRSRRIRTGEINAQLDCPVTPAEQDLRVAYGDGYSPRVRDAFVGPRENGPGGWQLPSGYPATISLTLGDRAGQLVNAQTFVDAEGAGDTTRRTVTYPNGTANVTFRPTKPGKIRLCTIAQTGDEEVLSHAFTIDVVDAPDGRWTTAGGRVLDLKNGEATWLTPEQAGVTARAADLGGFLNWLRGLFAGTAHAVAKALSGEGRVSLKTNVVVTQSKVGTSQVTLDGVLKPIVTPPVSVLGRCLVSDGKGTVRVIACKVLRTTANSALLATTTGGGGAPMVAAGAGNVISHNGSTIISQGGSSLVGLDGGTLIGLDGATLIGNAGNTLIGNAGNTLVGLDGATLIGLDGATLIGLDGATLTAALGADALAVDVRALANEGQAGLSPKLVAGLIGLDGATLIGLDGATIISQGGSALIRGR